MTAARLSLRTAGDVRADLATRLRERRRRFGWSRAALAERSGVPAATIKRFEREGEISLRQFSMLLVTLGELDALDRVMSPQDRPPGSIDDVAPPARPRRRARA